MVVRADSRTDGTSVVQQCDDLETYRPEGGNIQLGVLVAQGDSTASLDVLLEGGDIQVDTLVAQGDSTALVRSYWE